MSASECVRAVSCELSVKKKASWYNTSLKVGQVTCIVIDCLSKLPHFDNQRPKNSIKEHPVSLETGGYKSKKEVLH